MRSSLDLAGRTVGQAVNAQVQATTTSYDGSNGGLPGFRASSGSPSRLTLSGFTTTPAMPEYGFSRPFTINLVLIPLLPGPQTANINFLPTCGNFTGEELSLTVTYTGIASTFTAPPTFAQNLYTGNVSEPVSTSTGELFGHHETPDFALGGSIPLTLRRYYASYLSANGVSSALGANWMHNFDLKLAISGTTATVTLFRGKTVRFTRSGTAWTLASTERVPYQLAASGTGNQFLSPESNLIYSFDANGALARIEDRNGNALTVTQGPNGPVSVSDGLGRALTFTYTGTSLTGVRDQSGRTVAYTQSGGTLASYTDAAGRRSTYAYTSNANLAALMTSETRPAGNQPFTQTFDTDGRVATQADSRGNALNLAYTSAGATVTEPLNVSFTQAHDGQRNLTSQTAGGVSSQYTYDGSGRPLTATDRLGNRLRFTWDSASGRLASVTDVLGNATSYTYATATQTPFTFHQLTAVRNPDGSTVAIAYDAKGNATSIDDSRRGRTQFTYNSRGQVLTRTSPRGTVETFTYGQDGSLASSARGTGTPARYTYDAAGRLTGETLPGGATRSYQYDAVDNVTRYTDEQGNAWSASWDANNHLRTVTDALSAVSTFGYDNDDRPSSFTDALGNVTRRSYDALGRTQTVTNPAGNTTTFTYDNLNRPASAVDASGKGPAFGWDQENRLLSITDALSRATSVTRDQAGRVTAITTPLNERSTIAYDSMSRITSITNPLDEAAQYQYDSAGRLTSAALPGGVTGTFQRNEAGQVAAVRDPNGGAWTPIYAGGRLSRLTDPLGRSIGYEYDGRRLSKVVFPQSSAEFSYDEANNLTRVAYLDGPTLSYLYDRNGRLLGGSGAAIEYDAAGRIKTSDNLQIGRDAAGRISSVTYATGKTVRYTYDNRGLLSTVADWVGGATAFAYDEARQMTSMTLPNGVREEYTYDRNGRPASIRATRSGAAILSIALRRDAAGRVTGADRTAATVPDPAVSYRPMAYDAAHQPAAGASDDLGRLTADAVRSYKWDPASRLTSYAGADGAASFTYDGLGQRVSRSAGGVTESYALNYALPWPAVSIVRAGGVERQYYVWLPNGVLHSSIAPDGSRRFYHFDESGSTALLTDDSGAVTDTYAITPYGESVAATGSTANPFTFQGAFGVMQEGATGLFYMRARYYDSVLARFLSRDPRRSADPRELNPYQFAHGNPVEGADPSGQLPVEYVKGADTYGAGYFYIPGTENVLKIGGSVRQDGAGDFGEPRFGGYRIGAPGFGMGAFDPDRLPADQFNRTTRLAGDPLFPRFREYTLPGRGANRTGAVFAQPTGALFGTDPIFGGWDCDPPGQPIIDFRVLLPHSVNERLLEGGRDSLRVDGLLQIVLSPQIVGR